HESRSEFSRDEISAWATSQHRGKRPNRPIVTWALGNYGYRPRRCGPAKTYQMSAGWSRRTLLRGARCIHRIPCAEVRGVTQEVEGGRGRITREIHRAWSASPLTRESGAPCIWLPAISNVC